jgi:5-formyltetrahydrofolate cyclo-ligase
MSMPINIDHHHTPDPATEKQAARKKAASLRQKLAQNNADSAVHLAAHADDLVARYGTGSYAGYLAIHSELSPALLLQALADRGVPTALPVTPAAGQPLQFLDWQPGDRLVDGRFGTKQPVAGAPPVRPHVVLVPLLAFDLAGWRLGYGGGYYDRSIAALRDDGMPVVAIGVGYDGQRVDKVPVGPYDMPLDAVLTPAGLIGVS